MAHMLVVALSVSIFQHAAWEVLAAARPTYTAIRNPMRLLNPALTEVEETLLALSHQASPSSGDLIPEDDLPCQ